MIMDILYDKAAMVFGGQGSQFTGMGKLIYDSFSEAKSIFLLASEVTGYDVAAICFNAPQYELNKTIYSQVCTLVVELAIYEVFKNKQITLHAVAGFSLGEYAALVIAGVLDIETAFKLVNNRAQVMENDIADSAGKMVAIINSDVSIIEKICNKFGCEKVAVTSYNAFNQVVVSVAMEIYDEFISCIKLEKGRVIPLNVNRPFHHPMMKSAADKFKHNLDNVAFQDPVLPLYMNVNGEIFRKNDSLSENLYEQIIKPVQWIKTIQNMRTNNVNIFYEISPKPILSAFIKNIIGEKIKVINVQDIL